MLEASAVASLVRMNDEQLNHHEFDGASDMLFNILYAEMNAVEEVVESNEIKHLNTMTKCDLLPTPLSSPEDSNYLSPLQCYIRENCVEYFEATGADIDCKSSSKSQQQRGRR